jgi:hypothetical protein
MSIPCTQTGGAKIGHNSWSARNATTPFAHITVTAEEVEISIKASIWNEQYRFQSIKTYKGMFSTGVQIVHSRPDVPALVVFWTVSPSNLNLLLSALSEALDAPAKKRPEPESEPRKTKDQPNQKLQMERKKWQLSIFAAVSSTVVVPFFVHPHGFSTLFHPHNVFTLVLLGILVFNWLHAGTAIVALISSGKRR